MKEIILTVFSVISNALHVLFLLVCIKPGTGMDKLTGLGALASVGNDIKSIDFNPEVFYLFGDIPDGFNIQAGFTSCYYKMVYILNMFNTWRRSLCLISRSCASPRMQCPQAILHLRVISTDKFFNRSFSIIFHLAGLLIAFTSVENLPGHR